MGDFGRGTACGRLRSWLVSEAPAGTAGTCVRMEAVSAERSPQTWGTRPWQLWFLVSRQPPPGLTDKGSNGPICVPSPRHPEFPLHSTHNKVPDG